VSDVPAERTRKENALAQAPQAHVEVMEPGAFGKIVLVP
jgi:hypothetical protein